MRSGRQRCIRGTLTPRRHVDDRLRQSRAYDSPADAHRWSLRTAPTQVRSAALGHALNRIASATGGNGFARDVLAGIAAFYSAPMYENMGKPRNLNWASFFLGLVAILVALPAYWCVG